MSLQLNNDVWTAPTGSVVENELVGREVLRPDTYYNISLLNL